MFKKYKEQITKLESENNILRKEVNNLNLIISSLNEQIKSHDDKIDIIKSLDDIISEKKQLVSILSEQVTEQESKIDIQQLCFDDIKDVQYYKEELLDVKSKQKDILINKTYYNIKEKWVVNGKSKQGEDLVKFLTNIVITSYNLMVNANIDKVNTSNKCALINRFKRTYDIYNDKLSQYGVELSKEYLNLILQELDIMFNIYLAKENEKEERRRQREIIKEQAKAEAEIKKNKEKLEKRLLHLRNQLDKGSDVQEEIDDVQKQLDDDDYMLVNKRAGYLYIISNGSLGKDVVKIGITRRTEYQNRIDELSGSNIPFKFKPNCIIWSDDVFALESALHREFSDYRVNKIKTHREFFKLPLEQIEKTVKDKYCSNAIFEYDIIDEDFIASGYKICENFKEG